MCMDCKGEYFERDLGRWCLCVYGRGREEEGPWNKEWRS